MKAKQLIGRSDAMYCGIAMVVTILELALIATNPQLGAYALEIALLLQLIISASLEFYAGATLSFYIGIGNTMLTGFALKLASAVSFLIGFYLSYQGLIIITWCFLVTAFALDSIGTGCLKSTFRPTYNRIHYTLTGKNADFAIIAFSFLTLRLLLPLALLLLASYVLSSWQPSYSAAATFSTIIICRFVQFFYAHQDLKLTRVTFRPKQHIRILSLSRLRNAYQRNPSAFYGFLTGNLFESIILMYAIGLLYQYKHLLQLPGFLSWLGSSMIAFSLYLISIIIGGGLLVKIINNTLPKSLALIFFSLTLSSSLWIIIDTQDKGLFYALTIFSFSGVIIGLILMRLSTNSILQTSTDLEAVDFFLLVEVTTTFCIVIIAGIAALIFGPDSLIKGFGSGITIAMLIYFSYLYKKQKQSTL